MSVTATVTDVLTEGYVEVAPLEDGQPGARRCIAETSEKKQRRGDVVELKPAKPYNEPIARVAYFLVLVLFLFGYLVYKGAVRDKVLSGMILGGLGFVLAWLMNRRTRLSRRLEYRVTRTLQNSKDTGEWGMP